MSASGNHWWNFTYSSTPPWQLPKRGPSPYPFSSVKWSENKISQGSVWKVGNEERDYLRVARGKRRFPFLTLGTADHYEILRIVEWITPEKGYSLKYGRNRRFGQAAFMGTDIMDRNIPGIFEIQSPWIGHPIDSGPFSLFDPEYAKTNWQLTF